MESQEVATKCGNAEVSLAYFPEWLFKRICEMSKQAKYSNTGVSPVPSLIDNVHAITESYFVVQLVGLHLDNLYDVK